MIRKNTTVMSNHRLICMAVADNINGDGRIPSRGEKPTPKFIESVNDDPKDIVHQFYEYLKLKSVEYSRSMHVIHAETIACLEARTADYNVLVEEIRTFRKLNRELKKEFFNKDTNLWVDDERHNEYISNENEINKRQAPLSNMKEDMKLFQAVKLYCNQMPVLSYNGKMT